MTYQRLYPQNIAPGGTKVQKGFENDDKEIKRIYELLNDIGGLQLFGSKRQTVVYGPTNNSGTPNYLTASGLNITIDGGTKPIILAFAAGFNTTQGTVDYLDSIGSVISSAWTLPANNKCYLYIDKDANTGLLSYGYTLSADQYLAAAPASPVLDQCYFNTVEMKMYRYNGSSWEEKRRIFIASAVADASSITITQYPMQSPMDKTGAMWGLIWSEKFILSKPTNGRVSPIIPLTRDGICNTINFYPQGTPSSATSIYAFQGQALAINSALTDVATSVTLSAPVTNAAPFYALIDSEVVQVTAVSGMAVTISRAQLGTTAAAHNIGAVLLLSIGNISLSTGTPARLVLNNLVGTKHDQFVYAVVGNGLSSVAVTIVQEWVNR